jgi:hypothetical protein
MDIRIDQEENIGGVVYSFHFTSLTTSSFSSAMILLVSSRFIYLFGASMKRKKSRDSKVSSSSFFAT